MLITLLIEGCLSLSQLFLLLLELVETWLNRLSLQIHVFEYLKLLYSLLHRRIFHT